ncbi:unnamed protein product [Heterobilharzia americana]|nr:unnamed protein product [Heterobilharzia americana]
MLFRRKLSYRICISKRSKAVLILVAMLFQILSITLYRYYTVYKPFEEEFLNTEALYSMDTLTKCTESENMWLQCIEQLNNLSTNNYARVRGFDSSVRLIHTPLNCTFLDIQIPFKRNNKHYSNVTLNELYFLSNDALTTMINGRGLTTKNINRGWHHPKYFSMKEALNAIQTGLPDKEMPVNGGPIIVIQLPKKTCNPTETTKILDLIVIVKSCIYCFDKRSYARETYMRLNLWKDFKVGFVFVVGLPTPNETDIFHFDGVHVNLHRNAKELSQKYKTSRWIAAKKLENESKVYKDMLIGSFHDTYFNLTLKLILTYRWAVTFCNGQAPLYIFLDDDYAILPNNTISLIRGVNASSITSVVGGPVHHQA